MKACQLHVYSDNSWTFIPEFVPNIHQKFQQEVENYDPTTQASEEALYEDVIPTRTSPASQQKSTILKRAIEEELR